jgi:hypothetical protein
VAGAISACEGLSGLDDITETACAPNCGSDASGPGEPSEGAAESAVLDRSDAPESNRPDAGQPDASTPRPDSSMQEAAQESGMVEESGMPEAGMPDAPVDSGVPGMDAGPCGTVYFQEHFDDNSQGWNLGTSWGIEPTCANPPTPTKGNPDPTVDHTTGTAGGVAGAYPCGNNPKQVVSALYATSPAVDVSSAPALFLTFYRWLNSDESTYMTSTVDVWSGSAWVNLYSNPASVVTDAAWTLQSFDVTAYKNAAFKVRFGYSILTTGVYQMSCWNVDDVVLSTVACP